MAARTALPALLLADGATLAGSAMATTALPFIVLDIGGDASAMAAVAATVLIAELAALLIGGIVADRVPRHRVMAAADLIQAAAPAALALLFAVDGAGVGAVVALSAVRGVGLGLFLPASQGILPQIVDADRLVPANSLRRLTANLAQIGGALAGGVLVGLWGPSPALLVIAAAFLVGAAARTGIRLPPAVASAADEGLTRSAVRGWRDFASRRWLWTVVAGFAVINAVYVGCIGVLGPLAVKDAFRGASTWGAVAAATAAGAGLAAAASYAWRPRRPLVLAIAFAALIALEPAALALGGHLVVVLAGAVAAGVGLEVFGILWVTVLQQHVPTDVLSRVSALDAMGSFAISPLGPVIAAAAAAGVGLTTSLIASAAIVAAVCAVLLLIPDVQRLPTARDQATA